MSFEMGQAALAFQVCGLSHCFGELCCSTLPLRNSASSALGLDKFRANRARFAVMRIHQPLRRRALLGR